MIPTIVSTEEFWELSCKAAFIRKGRNMCTIDDKSYYCSNPPDEVPGFIEGKIAKIKVLLGIKEG